MDLRALRYFVAAVECGSVSAAAQRCFVAQPSITLAINKLEDDLETRLLHRHPRGVKPTESGEELYAMAKQLLQQAETIEAHFKTSKPSPLVRVSLESSIGIEYVEAVFNQLQHYSPQARIELVAKTDISDLHICHQTETNVPADFHTLAREEYMLLIPPHHWLAHQNSFRMEDLDGEPLIERRHCENRPLFDQVVSYFGISLNTVAIVDNEEWARGLVAAGIGLSIAPINPAFATDRFKYLPFKLQSTQTPKRLVGIKFKPGLSNELEELFTIAFEEHSSQYALQQTD